MTRPARLVTGTIVTLVALSTILTLWWLNSRSPDAPVVSAQEAVANACDLTDPHFDIVATVKVYLYDDLVPVKARVAGKDHHVVIGADGEYGEIVSVDGVSVRRDSPDGEWRVDDFPPFIWLLRLIGSADGDNIICTPLETTHVVGAEVVKNADTTKYMWAYSEHKDEAVDSDDNEPWTHRWEIWLDEDNLIVQIRIMTKDPRSHKDDLKRWDIVTSQIVNVGEVNIITKPTN